jgi:hypothetical protein
MKTEKKEELNKELYIKAELISRPNATNGKYRIFRLDQLEPENLVKIKDSDIFFLESLQMQADLADKMIAEVEAQGKDTTDLSVLKELSGKINDAGKPIHRSEAVMTAVFVSFRLIAYYTIAIAIWSLVFKTNFWAFSLYGIIAGLIISLLFVAPVISYQRTKERIRDIVFGAGSLVGNFGIIIGFIGLVAWIIRLIFF